MKSPDPFSKVLGGGRGAGPAGLSGRFDDAAEMALFDGWWRALATDQPVSRMVRRNLDRLFQDLRWRIEICKREDGPDLYRLYAYDEWAHAGATDQSEHDLTRDLLDELMALWPEPLRHQEARPDGSLHVRGYLVAPTADPAEWLPPVSAGCC